MLDLRAASVAVRMLTLTAIASVGFAAVLVGVFAKSILGDATLDAFLLFFASVAPCASLGAFSRLDDRKTATQAFLAALVMGFIFVVLPLSFAVQFEERQFLGQYDWFAGVAIYTVIAAICIADLTRRRVRAGV